MQTTVIYRHRDMLIKVKPVNYMLFLQDSTRHSQQKRQHMVSGFYGSIQDIRTENEGPLRFFLSSRIKSRHMLTLVVTQTNWAKAKNYL